MKGRNSGRIKHGDLSAVVEMLGGECHAVPDPYKDFGEMYQDDAIGAKIFIKSILFEGIKV